MARRFPEPDERYRSPQEIALRNAADSLGVAIGDDYPHGIATQTGDDFDAPDRVVAFREELLAYIRGRKQRRRRRLLAIGMVFLLIASTALMTRAMTGFSTNDAQRESSRGEGLDLPHHEHRRGSARQDPQRGWSGMSSSSSDIARAITRIPAFIAGSSGGPRLVVTSGSLRTKRPQPDRGRH